MRGKKYFLFLPALMMVLVALACSSKPKTSILLRDPTAPPKIVQETFAQEGKGDYFLMNDEGYGFRLIYLCENRVYNFVEEPEKNPVLVSIQPILDTLVEKKLSPNDRRRIWACLERPVKEEHSRVEELKRQVIEERVRVEGETHAAWAERERIVGEIEQQKKAAALKQRQMEEEMRKAEEERQRKLEKLEEEQKKKAEEERKLKAYRTGEKEKEEAPPPLPPRKVTESGVFLVMKETDIYEDPHEGSKVKAKGKKYDIFEVINSTRDYQGALWHQIIMGERVISGKGKRFGWSPEEKSYWLKNKLLAWVHPGEFSKVSAVKPLKLNPEILQYTGKKGFTPQKATYYEVTYDVNVELKETLFSWIKDRNGIRRPDMNMEEMLDLMKELSRTLWPIKIQNDILRGEIRVGFTPEQVSLSWGRPDHVNITKTLVGVHEQWVYGENPFPHSYVYFENGVVKNWEFLNKNEKLDSPGPGGEK